MGQECRQQRTRSEKRSRQVTCTHLALRYGFSRLVITPPSSRLFSPPANLQPCTSGVRPSLRHCEQVRELGRIKRAQEERAQRRAELAEIERRKNLSAEELAAEDARNAAAKPPPLLKKKWQFLQKYYHKGLCRLLLSFSTSLVRSGVHMVLRMPLPLLNAPLALLRLVTSIVPLFFCCLFISALTASH